MLIFVVLTGLITALDRWILARNRQQQAGEANVLIDYSRGFFPVILVVFLLRSFLVEPFTIPSSSMRPGLVVGDFILVNKFTYGIRIPVLNTVLIPMNKVQRGDVVVFNFPPNPRVNYIKRVIGLPGDTVEFRNKRLTINGQAIVDQNDGSYDYLEQRVAMIHNDRFKETIGSKTYDVLNIPDAPTLMLSQVTDFPGRDQCRYDDSGFVCKVPLGHYFMMGDNRDNSLDGRYWGFVDDRLLVGKAFFVWMNFSQLGRVGNTVR
jgi:signal peptidase I